jgi:hypothetical protein
LPISPASAATSARNIAASRRKFVFTVGQHGRVAVIADRNPA